MKRIIKSAMMFRNGNAAVFDQNGEQIPELQIGFCELWAKHAESLGFDPDGVTFESPDCKMKIFRTFDDGFNHEILR